jgi:hypothetical protein
MNNSSHTEVKGFITNLTFIKEFCISVCEYIRSSDRWKEHFVERISRPTAYNLAELLKAYRVTVNGEVKDNYNTFQDEYLYPYFKITADKIPTISPDLFNDFMKAAEEDKSSTLAVLPPLFSSTSRTLTGGRGKCETSSWSASSTPSTSPSSSKNLAAFTASPSPGCTTTSTSETTTTPPSPWPATRRSTPVATARSRPRRRRGWTRYSGPPSLS